MSFSSTPAVASKCTCQLLMMYLQAREFGFSGFRFRGLGGLGVGFCALSGNAPGQWQALAGRLSCAPILSRRPLHAWTATHLFPIVHSVSLRVESTWSSPPWSSQLISGSGDLVQKS